MKKLVAYFSASGVTKKTAETLAEAIGALPLPVVHAGLLCQARETREAPIPMAELDDFMAPQPETDNYLTMEATKHTLSFDCCLGNGISIDHVLLHK